MELTIKGKKWFGPSVYEVYDENKNILYSLKRPLVAFGDKYKIFDYNNMEVGEIKQSMSRRGKYNFLSKGQIIESLFEKIWIVNPEYELKNMKWSIKGNFSNLEYVVYDSGSNVVMDVSIDLFSCKVNIYDTNNILLCIMIALSLRLISIKK